MRETLNWPLEEVGVWWIDQEALGHHSSPPLLPALLSCTVRCALIQDTAIHWICFNYDLNWCVRNQGVTPILFRTLGASLTQRCRSLVFLLSTCSCSQFTSSLDSSKIYALTLKRFWVLNITQQLENFIIFMLIFTKRANYISQTLRVWQGVDDGRGGHLADVKSPILLLPTIISGWTYISDCASTLHPSILSLKKKNWLYFFREMTLWPILKRSGHCLDHHLVVGVSILLLLMRPGENGWGRPWLWWWCCWWW